MHIPKIIIITSLAALTTGCASTQQSVDTTNLNDLQNLTRENTLAGSSKVSKIRLDALKETAMTIGAQGGLAYRAAQLDNMTNNDAKNLSQIFNFNGLMLDHNVLPPVLQQSKQSLNISDPDTIRIADRTYQILKQARFVTTPPTWRDYLILDYDKPPVPDSTLLPKSDEERDFWIKYVNTGWENGIQQANNIYADSLARLKRDYEGMVLYRKLLAQNMVSSPFVATSDLGITSNADNSEIHINDQILRITAKPKLNSNFTHWNPVVVDKND